MKYYFWFVLLLFGSGTLIYGQENLYYYYGTNTRPVEKIEDAVVYKIASRRSDNRYVIKTFRKSNDKWFLISREKISVQSNGDQKIRTRAGKLIPKQRYRSMQQTDSRLYSFQEKEGNVTIRTGTSAGYIPLHLEGLVTEYHTNGKLKSVSIYRDNQLQSNENWLRDGSKYIDSIFYSADKEPEYKPGDKVFRSFILESLAQSEIDLTQVEDHVEIGWVVMETGEVEGVITLQGKYEPLNKLLIATIYKLPGNWEPAVLDGSPVRFFMTIPLNFRQKNTSFQNVNLSGGVLHYNRY